MAQIIPNIISNIIPIKTYEYPLYELQDYLEKYKFQPINKQMELNIYLDIEKFRDKLKNEYRIPGNEFNHLNFIINIDVYASVTCLNLFTACILCGKYVPHFIIKNYTGKFVFEDESYIEYANEKYIYHINNEIVINL